MNYDYLRKAFGVAYTDAEFAAIFAGYHGGRGANGNRAGRPPKGATAATATAKARLTPEMYKWLTAQPAGISGTIRQLIATAMDASGGGGRE